MKLLKLFLKILLGIIVFFVIVVITIIIIITAGKDFNVDKTTDSIDNIIGESLYEGFEERNGNTLNVDLDQDEVNQILNSIIIDSINPSYEDEDTIYSIGKLIHLKKAKIVINNDNLSLKARIKYGPLKTNFVATGSASYDASTSNIEFDFTSAKLGHAKIKPTKILKQIGNNEYIKDGKLIYPLELSSKMSDGLGKIIINECEPKLKIEDSKLRLSLDISKMSSDEVFNNVEYEAGDLKTHVLSSLTSSTTKIVVSKDDFNGYIREEYEKNNYTVSQEILNHEYSIKTRDDLYFDTLNKNFYYGVDIVGINSYVKMDFIIEASTTELIFTTSSFKLVDIDVSNELIELKNKIIPENKYKISYQLIESYLENRVDIYGCTINQNGDFEFNVVVL